MPSSSTPAPLGEERRQIGPNPGRAGVLRAVNRALGALLRSPLHRLVSRSLLLVEFTGRKTGKGYSVPVGYRRAGAVVSFQTQYPWWKNLRGTPIHLWLRGRPVDAMAEVVTDPALTAPEIASVLERAPRLARFYNVRMAPDGRPNPADLAELAGKTAMIRARIPDALAAELDREEGRGETLRGPRRGRRESLPEGTGDRLRGKVALVTGANAGIGKATALALAEQGATVVMVSRSRAKGELAAEEVIARSGNPNVELLVADLASQDAVRQLARDFLARRDRLDILVNNAGVYLPTRRLTADGLETTLATNYLAPFLLTELLLPALQVAAPSRIVNVSSGAQAWGRLDLDDLTGTRRRYNGLRAYAQSKLALVTWTYELARRLSGSGVTANVLEPGFVDTKLPTDMIPLPAALAQALGRPFMTTPEEGAATSIYLAASPRAQSYSGNFFSSKGRPIRSARVSYDREVARRLWHESERLVGRAGARAKPRAALPRS